MAMRVSTSLMCVQLLAILAALARLDCFGRLHLSNRFCRFTHLAERVSERVMRLDVIEVEPNRRTQSVRRRARLVQRQLAFSQPELRFFVTRICCNCCLKPGQGSRRRVSLEQDLAKQA